MMRLAELVETSRAVAQTSGRLDKIPRLASAGARARARREAVALGPGQRPEPFQVTLRRFGRKLDVERMRQVLPLAPFFFDCLYLDGDPFIDEPLIRQDRVGRGHLRDGSGSPSSDGRRSALIGGGPVGTSV